MTSQGRDPTFVLLHSPLVGLASWAPVRDELDMRGYHAVAPDLRDDEGAPYWRAYGYRAAEAITDLGADEVVLVPHSGAGSLVATVADLCVPEVRGVIFVDATLPADGQTRLQEMDAHDPDFAAVVRRDLERGETFPTWTDGDLAALVTDAALRHALIAGMQPRGLDFFEEPIPAPAWPGLPAAYLQLSPPYDSAATEAERLGWPVERLPLGHFATLAEPDLVAATILALYEVLQAEA